jgi:hypothetical protein
VSGIKEASSFNGDFMKLITNLVFLMYLFPFAAQAAPADWSEPGETYSGNKYIEVYYSKTCGCCKNWMKHLKDHQFTINPIAEADMQSIKNRYGVEGQYASCHTAIIDGYVIEGHVPADDIKRLLKQKPDIKGLSVPAMPVGTPGMEQGDRKDPFHVITLPETGKPEIFRTYKNY